MSGANLLLISQVRDWDYPPRWGSTLPSGPYIVDSLDNLLSSSTSDPTEDHESPRSKIP